MMKRGDVVTVYEDPITEEKPEGQAKLVKELVSSGGGYFCGRLDRRWLVRFTSEPETSYERNILDHPMDDEEDAS